MNAAQKTSTVRATIQEVVARKSTKLTEDMIAEVTTRVTQAVLLVDTSAGASNLITISVEPRINPTGKCRICGKDIEVGKGEAVLTIFKFEESEYKRPSEWVHHKCAVRAVETWIVRKEQQK